MPKRKTEETHVTDASPASREEQAAATETSKPEAKKRKPTKKQLEAAEAAARPQYDESARPPLDKDVPAFKILTWNVASLNATLKKDPKAISRLAQLENADVVCLQETKLQSKATEEMEGKVNLPGWKAAWACSHTKKGYSGTAVFSKSKPLSTKIGMGKGEEHDDEGRVITFEYPTFFLVNVYTPNAGEGLKRLDYKVGKWDPAFAEFIAELKAKKAVVVTGDLNCAPDPIDLHSPATNKKTPGFTEAERESFKKNQAALGLVDCFRRQYPDTVGYTYWSIRQAAREKNKGWRLDFFLVTENLVETVHDCFILKSYEEAAKLSDHCPIGITLKL